MTSSTLEARSDLTTTLYELRQRLTDASPSAIPEARDELSALATSAKLLGLISIATILDRLALLTEVWECLEAEEPTGATNNEIAQFLRSTLERIGRAGHDPASQTELDEAIRYESQARWGEYLDLLSPEEPDCAPEPWKIAATRQWFVQDEDGTLFDHPLNQDISEVHESPTSQPREDEGPAIDPATLLKMLGLGALAKPSAPDRDETPLKLSDAPRHSINTREQAQKAVENVSPSAPTSPSSRENTKTQTSSLSSRERIPREQVALLMEEKEIRDAYLADAHEFLERIDALLVALVSDERSGFEKALPGVRGALHTLKGASGSVGLTDLGTLIHDIEEKLSNREVDSSKSHAVADLLSELMTYLDQVLSSLAKGESPDRPPHSLRNRLLAPLAIDDSPKINYQDNIISKESSLHTDLDDIRLSMESRATAIASAGVSVGGGSEPEGGGLVRVEGERIEELMDLVSELLSRRGAWSGRVEGLKTFAAAAQQSRYRLTTDLDRLSDLHSEITSATRSRSLRAPGLTGDEERTRSRLAESIRRLTEQAEDLTALSESARSAISTLSDEGDALARLSRRLWSALQAIRVVPVRGLFQKLARVARDAARVEGREVEIVTEGEDLGVDRSIQDKAYEPLLHLVRNAVGHGIEPADERRRAGKPSKGKVTFEARNESNIVVFRVSDDGRGLDNRAIEAKARQLGLLKPDETPSVERLHKMIFEAGFSTRGQANAIAGRGVGMDVVAREIERLHGIIAIDSRPGKGTNFTVRLPARLALQQSMIARVSSILICLPLEDIQSVDQPVDLDLARPGRSTTVRINGEEVLVLDPRIALGFPPRIIESCPKLLLFRGVGERIAILVDAIEGPGELVVKPLCSLLAGHPTISGAALSGSGEIVFALDIACLKRSLVNREANPDEAKPDSHFPRDPSGQAFSGDRQRAVLVVDDSLSVRRITARKLRDMGFRVDEVADGVEALTLLREREYRLILTDLEMPRMDGFALVSELARSGTLARTPIVVASTKSDPETQRNVIERGATAFVAKPIDDRAWTEVLEPLLEPNSQSTRANSILNS